MREKKLTPAQIEEILALKEKMEANGEPFFYSHVAKLYGVTGQTLRRNIAPSEYDRTPRPPTKYNPEKAKAKRESFRIYQFRASKDSETDKLIIDKMDSVDNKQRYIKELILKDIDAEEV